MTLLMWHSSHQWKVKDICTFWKFPIFDESVYRKDYSAFEFIVYGYNSNSDNVIINMKFYVFPITLEVVWKMYSNNVANCAEVCNIYAHPDVSIDVCEFISFLLWKLCWNILS